jgi:hypothetical protein
MARTTRAVSLGNAPKTSVANMSLGHQIFFGQVILGSIGSRSFLITPTARLQFPRVAQRDTLKERREKSPSCGQSMMGFLFHIRALT